MRTLLSFIAILLLVTSSLPAGFADITPVDSSNIESIEQPITQTKKTISIDLDESMGFSTDDPRKTQVKDTSLFIADHTSKSIHLDEDLSISTSASDQKIHYDYVTVQIQPTVERILHTDKLRDDRKKNPKIESIYLDDLDQQQSEDLISIDSNIIQTTFFADPFNLITDLISEQNIFESVNIFEEQSITNTFNSISNFDPSLFFDNSFIVVIFAPLVFFLFIFAEDVKFKFEKVRPFLSLIFAVIILSTAVITPYSISSVYWPEAYADTGDIDEPIYDNTTASTDNTSSSSTPAEDTETVEDSTSDNTDASVGSTSSSSTPAEDTESTEVSSSTQPTASTDNTSSSSTPAEDTETVEDSTSDNTDASVGSTSSSSTPAEDTESTEVSSSTQPTASTDNTSSSSTPAEDTETVEDSTSDNTDASVGSTSSSSTPAEDTESTEVSSTNSTTTEVIPTNSTTTEVIPTNSTTTEVIPTNSTTTEVIPTNSTTTEVIPTNSTTTEVIPTNSTTTEVIPTNSTTTEVIPTNSTTTEVIPTNSTVIPGTNSTDIIPVNGTVIPGTNSTDIIPVNGTVIPGTNSTDIIPVNGTVIPGTNSTDIIPVNGTVIPGTNSTDIIPVNGTVIPGTNSTDIIPVNGTVIPGTNSTIVIVPNATESWSFDTQNNGSRFIGDVYIEESDSSLILDGDGYLSNDGNSTSDLSNISITAWVNPDYSGGSAEFTVISKENAFALTINNNIEPQHIAIFSVFDGIKWHTVETLDEIGNDWSHIAATFNGTTLSIYTNGTHSNTNESVEKIELTIEGQLEVKTIETIESTSDVVVGASLDNNRSLDDITKQFYGEIKEVNVFNVYLTAEQIAEIYSQTLPMIESLYNNTAVEVIEEDKEIIVIDVLAPIPVTNSTNINGTNINTIDVDTTNSTDTVITFNETQNHIPIETELLNEELNQLTLSTWINPSYTSGSAEFTVVSKENSFVLGINNIYSPEKVPTFAIFDGITWTKISGTTQINDWSHLVAVINGTEISLYLNGNLESSTTVPESFVILDGEVSTASAEIAENDSDLIIGAYLNSHRNDVTLSNHFSGLIDDVLVYKDALSQAQINEIYSGYVTPSVQNEIPFEANLLSFTDTVTVFLNNELVSETIHVAPIDPESETPSVVQSISFGDYVTYKVNGNSNEYSVEVMSFTDVVVATIINSNSTSVVDDLGSISDSLYFTDVVVATIINSNSTSVVDDLGSISDSLYFTDVVVATIINSNSTSVVDDLGSISDSLSFSDQILIAINQTSLISLSESLPLDSSFSLGGNTTLSNGVTSEIQLEHDIIEINKPVTWTHDVIFSNDTESVAIEIPADAEIIMVKSFNGTSETIIFDSEDSLPNNFNYTGLYDDQDISDKDLKKYFRLLDSVQTIESNINKTNDKIAYYANLDTAKAHKKLDKLNEKLEKLEDRLENKLSKLANNVPLASLQQVDEMIQEEKPLKVLLLNNTDANIELTFTTPAAYTEEQDNSTNAKFDKKVTVAHDSALHYTNVTAFSDIPEELVIGGTDFRLFWNIKSNTTENNTTIPDTNSTTTEVIPTNSTTTSVPVNGTNIPETHFERVDVTDDPRFAVEFVDTDGNGIADRMQWIVPQLSEQEFDIEADLQIINVQSYPAVGGTWKVRFTTNGTADLIITAVNGTTFGTVSPDDLKFLELNNGTHTLSPIVNGNSITYYNYSSTEEGFEESEVLTPFKHHLMFQFGNKTAFAHNSAFIPNGPEAIILNGDPIVLGSPDTTDGMTLTNPMIPGWDEPATRTSGIFTHDPNGGSCNGIDDSCTEIQVSEAGTYRVNYGLSLEKSTVTAARYQAISFVQNDTDGTGGYGTETSCYDAAYVRSADNHRTGVWSGECLVELEADGKVRIGTSKVSSDAGSGSISFADDENWFSLQKVENPTISLRTSGASLSINNTPDDMTFVDADIVTYDTSTFTFDGSSPNAEITVDEDGFYKVSYSALYNNANNRQSIIGKIQTNTSGSFVDDIYGGSLAYNRDSWTGASPGAVTHAALSASTILKLNAGDEIKFVSVDETTRTGTATDYHLDVEFIGPSSTANVLRISNSTGGVDLDQATDVLIDWDNADDNTFGSAFTFTGDTITPILGPFTFDADNDADESAWSWDNPGAVTDQLAPANTARSWSHDTDDTASSNIGPQCGQEGAAPPCTDGYVYTEMSSGGAFDDVFSMTLVETIDASNLDWEIEFYWNQRGNDNTGTLTVETNENGAGWVTRGTYGGGDIGTGTPPNHVWNQENLDLSSAISGTSTQIRLVVTQPSSGTTWHNDFGIDSITLTSSHATAQSPTEEITINTDGLYHISYGIDATQNPTGNERFGQKTRIQIDSGSGYANAVACFGDSFARGVASSNSHLTSTAATSCLMDLSAGDKLRVVSLREGDMMNGENQITTANETYLTIHFMNISIPPLSDSLSFNDQVESVVIKNVQETLSFVDTVTTTQDVVITLTESFSLSDAPIFVNKSGQQLVSLVESISFDDGTITNQVQPFKAVESLSFLDEVDFTFTGTISLTESLSLDDGTIEAVPFIPSNPDFKVQHDTVTLSGGSTSATITEGIDYEECTGDCFIMQVSTRHTGMGRTSGGATTDPDQVTTYISNDAGLNATGGSVTFNRVSTVDDNRIAWQILEYIGPENGPNEMKVLGNGTVTFDGPTSVANVAGSAISGGAADDNDVAVLITGVSSNEAGTFDWETHMVTTGWNGDTNQPFFNRTATGSDTVNLSYAVVEFTGPNWNLQRIEHTGSDLGLSTTETITDVGDLSRAFILQAQQRNADSTTADGLCETGERVYLSSTTTVDFNHEFGTNACTYDTQMEEVVWILSNTNTDVGKRMIVEHQQPDDQLNTSGSEEENWTVNINSLTYGLDETGIYGFTSNSDGAGETYPRGTIVAEIDATTEVNFWQSDSGQEQGYSFSVVQWPRSQLFSFSFEENLSLSDDFISQSPRTESLSFVDTVTTTKDVVVTLTESFSLSDAPIFVNKSGQQLVSLVESISFDDGTITNQVQPFKAIESLSLQAVLSYTIADTVTLTESLSFDDGTVESVTFVPSNPDFKVQHDTVILSGASSSATISEGVDYEECTGDCFIMQVSTRQTGMGRTSGGGIQDVEDVTTYISNDGGLNATGGSVTFSRDGTTNDNRIAWQILEYIGPENGPNEMKVLGNGTVQFGSSTANVAGSAISGGAADDNDVAVIITGISGDANSSTDYDAVRVTSGWNGDTNQPFFNRTATGSVVVDVSYAVVEFTGINWNLQRIEHTGVDAPFPTQTETITDVGDLSRAFILQAQQRNAGGVNNICETGERVHLSATNTLSFSHEFGTGACTFDNDMEEVVWILSNTDTQVGKRMIVEHQQPSDQLNESGLEEENWTVSTNSLTYGLDETGIYGFTSNSDGTDTSHPRGTIVAEIDATTNVNFWQSDSGEDQGYSFSVVQWPRSKQLSIAFDEGFTISDDSSISLNISLTESLPLDDGTVDATNAASVSLTESLPLDDGTIETTADVSVSLTESLSLDDGIIDFTADLNVSLTESLPLDDGTVESTADVSVSLTESLPLDDGTVESTKSASVSLTESLPLDDGIIDFTADLNVSLTESLPLDDGTVESTADVSVSLTESLPLDDGTVESTADVSVSLTESLSLDDGTVESTADVSVSLTESLPLDDGTVESTTDVSVSLTESLPLR